MQLVLVDNCDAHFTRVNRSNLYDGNGSPIYNYNLSEQVILRHDQSSCQHANDLVQGLESAITGNQPAEPRKIGCLNLSLTYSASSGRGYYGAKTYDLVVSGDAGLDILKELRGRFQDKVQISVYIKCTTQLAQHYGISLSNALILSAEGMVINENYYTCTLGSIYVSHIYVLQYEYGGPHVQITADISEDALIPKVEEVSLPEKTRKILEQGWFSDVIITAENGVEIKAHKCFLVGTSPVFQRMFGSKMQEASTGNVDMTDMSEEGVKAFLRYLYVNDRIASDENISVAFELLYAAHKYDIPGLEGLMTAYLLKRKNEDFGAKWALKTYMFAKNIESAFRLKKKAIHILRMKFDELKTLSEYNELFENQRDAKELCEDFAKAPVKK